MNTITISNTVCGFYRKNYKGLLNTVSILSYSILYFTCIALALRYVKTSAIPFLTSPTASPYTLTVFFGLVVALATVMLVSLHCMTIDTWLDDHWNKKDKWVYTCMFLSIVPFSALVIANATEVIIQHGIDPIYIGNNVGKILMDTEIGNNVFSMLTAMSCGLFAFTTAVALSIGTFFGTIFLVLIGWGKSLDYVVIH